MKQNERLKNFNLQHLFKSLIAIAIIITSYQTISFGALKNDDDDDYVVHIFFRNFYDQDDNKDNKFDVNELDWFNKSSRWDSIRLLVSSVKKQNPKNWWFNNLHNPRSMIVKFNSKARAESFYNKLETNKNGEYSFIVQKYKLEKYDPHKNPKKPHRN